MLQFFFYVHSTGKTSLATLNYGKFPSIANFISSYFALRFFTDKTFAVFESFPYLIIIL